MSPIRSAALAGGALLLAACGASPEQSIEKDCVRLGMFSDMASSDEASRRTCACFAGKLKDSMSEKDLGLLAKALRDSKTMDDFEGNAEKHGLGEQAAMNMIGAAKSCAI